MMDNWQIIQRVKANTPNNEAGWAAMDAVWRVLDGIRDGLITREEGIHELHGIVWDPAALLEEVGTCKSSG